MRPWTVGRKQRKEDRDLEGKKGARDTEANRQGGKGGQVRGSNKGSI